MDVLLIGRLKKNDPTGTEMLVNLINHFVEGIAELNIQTCMM